MKHLTVILALGLVSGFGLARAADFDATVRWASTVTLSMPVSGVVRTVNAEVGQAVQAGEVLLALEDTLFQAALDRAQAALVRSRSRYKEAKRDYEHAQELYARTVLSTVALETAEQKYRRAGAAVKAARAQVRAARYALDRSTIRAPFDGWVIRREVEPGQTVVSELAARPLLVMVKKGRYLARARLKAAELRGIQAGQPAIVKVAGRSLNGRVSAVALAPAEDGYYTLDVKFSLEQPVLRAGQPAEVEVSGQ